MKKIRLLYFSGLYSDNIRGVPFIDNRFNIIKRNLICERIYYLKQIDTNFVTFIKKIIINKYYRNNGKKSELINRKDWMPIKYTNNLKLSFINLFSKREKIKYLSEVFYKNVICKGKYDLVHVHWAYPAGAIFNEIKKRWGLPYVLTLHGSDINNLKYRSKEIQKLTLEALENADKCIFVCNQLLKNAQELHYSGKNAIIIPNGFNPNIFYYTDKKQAKEKIGINSDKLVGFVGNLIDIKNVFVLPDIFENIKKKYSDVEFVIIGDGNLRSCLMHKFKEKSLSVKFTGNINQYEVANYMRAMDVLIIPSKNEGWACVIKEAHACGTYVVGSNRGGIPETIGEMGKTFELNDYFISKCTDHILEVFNNGYDVNKIIQSSSYYTWENIVQQEMKVYFDILKNIGLF